jgi:hypothetical protein
VYGYPISFDFSPWSLSDISLPIARARWLKRNPPRKNNDEPNDRGQQGKKSVTSEEQRRERYRAQVDRHGWPAK